MTRKYGKDKYINLIPDLETFLETYNDINKVINFNALISTNISVTIHPFRFSICKGTVPGSVSIFCTYYGFTIVTKYTYDINVFDTDINILRIQLLKDDIIVIVQESSTNITKMLLVRHKTLL